MKKAIPFRISLSWLVALCMVMLAGILGYYLYQSYQNERNAIAKETRYLFVNTIQELEGDILEKMVIKWTGENLDGLPPIQKHRTDSSKSLRIVHMTQDAEYVDLENASVDIRIEKTQLNTATKANAMSMFVQSSDSTIIDSLFKISPILYSELQDSFNQRIEEAHLDLEYRIIKKDTSDHFSQTHHSNTYLESSTGSAYGIEVDNLSSYALKKILPEILLSLFVVICTGISFYTMYRQLSKEKILSQQKQDLVQNITHELKTPVTTVSLALQAISDFARENPEKQQEYIDISTRELSRLSLLIDRVLSMNDISGKDALFISEEVELNKFLESIINTFKVQLQERGGTIQTDYSHDPIMLEADRQQLAGVFYNLIDNAIKYNNSEVVQINIRVQNTADSLQISVEDNGIGIPEKLKNKVFDSLYRVPQGNTHNVKGSGLGLALVEKAIHRLNGTISIGDSPSGGTRFNIDIPHR